MIPSPLREDYVLMRVQLSYKVSPSDRGSSQQLDLPPISVSVVPLLGR